MALAAKLYRTDDDRQADRHAVEVDATLRDPDNAPIDTIVLDLSTTGFRATAPGPIAPGSSVRLGLPGLGVNPARVVWQSGTVIGCQFDMPIPEEAIGRATTTRSVVQGQFGEDPAAAPVAPAPRRERLMAAGMPLPRAMAISTTMTLLWAWALTQFVQSSLVVPFLS